MSVETEKAVVDIPSPRSGHIARLHAKVGDRIKVGGGLVDFEEGAHPDSGTVMGVLSEKPKTPPPPPPPSAQQMAQPATKGSSVSERRAAASPAVRALAREKGIDLAGLKGTGPDGTITRADVEAAAGSVKSSGGDPLRGVRRTMAINMAKSHAEVVPATLWDEANIHSWWERGHGVTVRVIRAIAKACNAEPLLNTWFDAKSMSIRISKQVDLGIAVDTEDGLIVPVLRDVGNRDLDALRCDLDALKAAVRHRTVPLADLRDPTLTLSNFGTIAGRQGALVILPPQAAIVGVGGVSLQAIPQGDAVGFTHTLPLSLTFDHRIVSGGEAARFLKAMIGDLEIAQ